MGRGVRRAYAQKTEEQQPEPVVAKKTTTVKAVPAAKKAEEVEVVEVVVEAEPVEAICDDDIDLDALEAEVEAAEIAAYNAANDVARTKMQIEDLEGKLEELEVVAEEAKQKAASKKEAFRLASQKLSAAEAAKVEAEVFDDATRTFTWGYFPTIDGKRRGHKVYADERDARQASPEGTFDSARFWLNVDGSFGSALTPDEMDKYV